MFKIGQEVVASRTDPQNGNRGVVKNEIYEIEGIRKCGCKCNVPVYNVGIAFISDAGCQPDHITCSVCGTKNIAMNGVRWYSAKWFAPLLTDEQEADFEEAIQEHEYAHL